MQGAAGFTCNRFREKRSVHLVFDRRLANGAFEEENLVRKIDRVPVEKIQLELGRPHFLRDRIDLDALGLAECVHVVDERVEVVHRVDAVRLVGALGPAEPALRRLRLFVRIGVRAEQIELDLGRDDGHPTACFVFRKDIAQHGARRLRYGRTVAVVAVEKHRGGRIRGPGHGSQRIRVGHEQHVAIFDIVGILHVVARDRLREHALRHLHLALTELARRHDLAARRTCHVGHERLDVFDIAFQEPGLEYLIFTHVTPVAGSRAPGTRRQTP